MRLPFKSHSDLLRELRNEDSCCSASPAGLHSTPGAHTRSGKLGTSAYKLFAPGAHTRSGKLGTSAYKLFAPGAHTRSGKLGTSAYRLFAAGAHTRPGRLGTSAYRLFVTGAHTRPGRLCTRIYNLSTTTGLCPSTDGLYTSQFSCPWRQKVEHFAQSCHCGRRADLCRKRSCG